ncbi:hypothetical protein HZS_6243, partial [Henneguya salminicola]
DLIISFQWENPNNEEFIEYNQIFQHCLFEHDTHHNLEYLTIGLRLLFHSPNYFLIIDEHKFITLVNYLIEFSINHEEPCSTYSISRKFKGLSRIVDILIARIFLLMENTCDDSLTSLLNCKLDQTLKYDFSYIYEQNIAEKTLPELNFEIFYLFNYIDVGPITMGDSQIFHNLALLNYLIPIIKISDLVENDNFMKLIYNCINVKLCKSDALIGLSLKIINNCIDDVKFQEKFIETKGISRICSVPHILSSAVISTHILFKISKYNYRMKKLIEKNIDIAIMIMRYAIRSYPTSQDYHGIAFIINSFQYKKFFDIFLNEGGIKEIYYRFRETKWFCTLKNPRTASIYELNPVYDFYNIFVKYSMRLLLIYLIKQICSHLLKNISHSLPPFDVKKNLLKKLSAC